MTGENLISQMSNYFDFLGTNVKKSEGLWTSPYLDAWGLGLMVTHAIPCISQVDGRLAVLYGLEFYTECRLDCLSSVWLKLSYELLYAIPEEMTLGIKMVFTHEKH